MYLAKILQFLEDLCQKLMHKKFVRLWIWQSKMEHQLLGLMTLEALEYKRAWHL